MEDAVLKGGNCSERAIIKTIITHKYRLIYFSLSDWGGGTGRTVTCGLGRALHLTSRGPGHPWHPRRCRLDLDEVVAAGEDSVRRRGARFGYCSWHLDGLARRPGWTGCCRVPAALPGATEGSTGTCDPARCCTPSTWRR